MTRLPTPDEIISRANAEGHAYVKRHGFLPGQSTTEARMGFEIGGLQREIRTLCDKLVAFNAPEAPAGEEKAAVMVRGVEVEVHFTYRAATRATQWEPGESDEVEIHRLFIGGQDAGALFDGDRDDEIEAALLAHVRAQGFIAQMDRAQELAESAS